MMVVIKSYSTSLKSPVLGDVDSGPVRCNKLCCNKREIEVYRKEIIKKVMQYHSCEKVTVLFTYEEMKKARREK